MRTWLKDNGPAFGAFVGVIVALAAVLQLVIAGPMNRRFDDLREMINQRFDQQDKYMNARFDQQDRYMNARFDAMDQRFDAMGQRIDRLADEVSELRLLVTGIGERVSRNEGHIQIIREQLQTVGAPAP